MSNIIKIVAIIVLAAILFGYLTSEGCQNKTTKAPVDAAVGFDANYEPSAPPKKDPTLWERLKDYEEQLDFHNSDPKLDGGDGGAKIDACFSIASAAIYAENMHVDSMVSIGKTVKQKLVKYQRRGFPLFRRAYADRAGNKLWEEDIYVTIGGGRSEIITFTGGKFAANKNIKAAFDAIKNDLEKYRFKQARFRWFKGQEDYTYYKIESHTDTDVW